MFPAIRNHPFAVEASFDCSLVVTFAVAIEEVRSLIPECLEPDTFQDRYSFIAIAMVQTKDLRPKGFPKFWGSDFFLIGYRVFVRYTTATGKRLRGLYILKSETNRKRMEFFGNIFTRYKYTTTDIQYTQHSNQLSVASSRASFNLHAEVADETAPLPAGSPFKDWKEARRFEGPLPFTFSFIPKSRSVLIVEGVRQNWIPSPVKVFDYNFGFLDSLHLKNPILANAFIVRDIPYYWKKGKIERWKG
jgi:uncharacterized protein YqjF (DUF2071 family)